MCFVLREARTREGRNGSYFDGRDRFGPLNDERTNNSSELSIVREIAARELVGSRLAFYAQITVRVAKREFAESPFRRVKRIV